jgi:DNA oxidative demethylase
MTSPTPDLFGEPRLPGLACSAALIGADEEQALIARIDASGLEPFRFQGWLGKRLTTSFGWRYDFDDASFRETEAIPDWLQPLRDKAANFAGLEADALVHVLLTRYDPGAGIGWHRDRPVFEHVVGISLGNPATLRFRRRRPEGGFERFSVPLAPRTAYHLMGEARHQWEHSIAPMDEPRWSITFRSLSERGRRSAGQTRD